MPSPGDPDPSPTKAETAAATSYFISLSPSIFLNTHTHAQSVNKTTYIPTYTPCCDMAFPNLLFKYSLCSYYDCLTAFLSFMQNCKYLKLLTSCKYNTFMAFFFLDPISVFKKYY